MKEKSIVVQALTIKELTDHLQSKIDTCMESFMHHQAQLKAITIEIEYLEKKMYDIISELEPVESLIYTQNPQLEKIFESLKRVYRRQEDGIVAENGQ